MTEAENFHRKADAHPRQATGAESVRDRGRLIDEALHWHMLALGANGSTHVSLHDNDGREEGEAIQLSGA